MCKGRGGGGSTRVKDDGGGGARVVVVCKEGCKGCMGRSKGEPLDSHPGVAILQPLL